MAGPRVAFRTVGCRLNQAETAQIRSQFMDAGYEAVDFGQPCEVCVIHSCTITANAERTSVRFARSAKRLEGAPIVVLAGCAVEVDAERLRSISGADLVAGQDAKYALPERVTALLATRPPVQGPWAAESEKVQQAPQVRRTRALVKVQDGCDFRCAYCIVPAARGVPRSRPFVEVIEEVRALTANGYKACVLTGANLGCYRDGPHNLVDLLQAMERLPGLERVRLSSIELSTIERSVVDFMAQSERLAHYLHVPLQSGDDGILHAMGRRYSATEYRAFADYALSRIPRLGIGADVLCGFPGEDDAAFENTMALLRDIPFSNLHVFPYSARPGTRAASMNPQVPDPVKRARTAAAIELGHGKRETFAQAFLGRNVRVLIEEVDDHGHGTGWTGEYLPARLTRTPVRVNEVVDFRPCSAIGETLSDAPAPLAENPMQDTLSAPP